MTERFHPLLQGEVIHLQLTTQVWIIRRKRDQENMLEYALELGKGFDTSLVAAAAQTSNLCCSPHN